ncbi:glycosyl transferase family 1 [Clostridium polyendosporum]|uniref:Glycosyl transferase family 1 n=1 Tax=Clostridium polyendosporum TaxID=69208 RepID=A0A919VHZ7_9CLOT|nr:glycosyltransferase [Clostridium polyendosporum]GIM30256.1 glycosyl transferase family 1 [Clostridium polyendosporum]
MHILIIPSWYKTESNPTLGSFFREQAQALVRAGHKVTLLFPEISYDTKDIFNTKISIFDDEGVSTYTKKQYMIPKTGCFGFNVSFYKGINDLYNEAVKQVGTPDIIHAHSCLWAGYSAMKLSSKKNIPYLITEHFTKYSRGLIKSHEKPLIKKQIKYASKVIAVSEGLKNDLEEYSLGKEILVISNMVDVNKFALREQKSQNDKFKFLSVCYLMQKKGLDILLKAFAKSFKGYEDVELIIGGDGEEKDNLLRLTNELGISSQVKFLGALNRDEVIENMQSCNAFVLPSRFETFGVVFIEALACGKPIIATKTGGPDGIVNKGNGFLVEVEDIEGLSIAMKKIIDNISCYDAELIRTDCIKRFSEKAVITQFEQVYKDILGKK